MNDWIGWSNTRSFGHHWAMKLRHCSQWNMNYATRHYWIDGYEIIYNVNANDASSGEWENCTKRTGKSSCRAAETQKKRDCRVISTDRCGLQGKRRRRVREIGKMRMRKNGWREGVERGEGEEGKRLRKVSLFAHIHYARLFIDRRRDISASQGMRA